ncbi:IS5 family transposase [Streptomyces sp900105245]|uniref:IS5 family transposase n=1 Tax=Streptomyces sp. 900105245 TaxID=3154379 RepID=UPI00332F6332
MIADRSASEADATDEVGDGRNVRPDASGRPGESRCRGRRRWARRGYVDRRACPPARGRGPKRGLRDRALGRSRGGLTSKIHLACDGRGRPLAFVVPGGNTNDCTRFTAAMEAIRVPRIGPGRPGVQPDHVLGDKGYNSKAIRTWLRHRGIPHMIPERAARRPSTARHISTATSGERCFNRLKQWRGIATRYDRTAESYEAAVALASHS